MFEHGFDDCQQLTHPGNKGHMLANKKEGEVLRSHAPAWRHAFRDYFQAHAEPSDCLWPCSFFILSIARIIS